MPLKRSRIGASSSFGDIGVWSTPAESAEGWQERGTSLPFTAKPQRNSAKAMKPFVAEKSVESRPRILTLSSPVQESVDATDDEPIGEFLDKCYFCRKKIRASDEVFMYSYFRAFCTVECRNMQIAMDTEIDKASATSGVMQRSPTG